LVAPDQVGGIAGAIDDARPAEMELEIAEIRRVLAGLHGVAEGQGRRTRASGICRGPAIVQREARRARHHHSFAHADAKITTLANTKHAAAARDAGALVATERTAGAVVSILQRAGGIVIGRSDKLAHCRRHRRSIR